MGRRSTGDFRFRFETGSGFERARSRTPLAEHCSFGKDRYQTF